MSADNGVYVAKFPDGYRICHGFAIDNLWHYPAGSKEKLDTIVAYFGESEVYEQKSDAMSVASEMEENLWMDGIMVEYGVVYLGELPWKDTGGNNE